jgi:hypothetical protein
MCVGTVSESKDIVPTHSGFRLTDLFAPGYGNGRYLRLRALGFGAEHHLFDCIVYTIAHKELEHDYLNAFEIQRLFIEYL